MAENITQKLLAGNYAALDTVRTLVATPSLINPGFGYYTGQSTVPFVIPLATETHRQSLSAEVSESLIICKDQKKNVTDNIAPGTWSWTLSGYIPGSALLEQTNYWTPILRLRTDLLKTAAEKGYMFTFKDIDNTVYKRCVIQQLDIETQKDSRNATPFSMTLKQINVMDDNESFGSESLMAAIAEAGGENGLVVAAGTTIAVTVTSAIDAATNAI